MTEKLLQKMAHKRRWMQITHVVGQTAATHLERNVLLETKNAALM